MDEISVVPVGDAAPGVPPRDYSVQVKRENDDDSGHRVVNDQEVAAALCDALYSTTDPPQAVVLGEHGGGDKDGVKKRRRRRKIKAPKDLPEGAEHFPYRCDVCEKGLRSLAALKYHERIHSGETPFECRFCSRRFAVASHLGYHERTQHTGEKPYECSLCGRKFAVSNHLRYHERGHTGEKPFRCGVCGKGFTSNFNLKYHEGIHAGVKPHTCDVCGKKYRSKAGLTGHQMKKGHHEKFQILVPEVQLLPGDEKVSSGAKRKGPGRPPALKRQRGEIKEERPEPGTVDGDEGLSDDQPSLMSVEEQPSPEKRPDIPVFPQNPPHPETPSVQQSHQPPMQHGFFPQYFPTAPPHPSTPQQPQFYPQHQQQERFFAPPASYRFFGHHAAARAQMNWEPFNEFPVNFAGKRL